MEHRWGTRMSIRLPVWLGGDPLTLVKGVLRDVSLSGAYIETGGSAPSGNPLLVEIGAAGSPGTDRSVLRAFVVRRDADGLGIEWCEFAAHPIRALLADGSQNVIGLRREDEETTPLAALPTESRGTAPFSRRPSVPGQGAPLR